MSGLLTSIMAATLQVTENDFKVPKGTLTSTNIAHILQVVFGLVGAIAFLIVTIAGFQYVLSQGDPQKVAKAKNTIIYALVGIVICVLAFTIVGFTLGKVG